MSPACLLAAVLVGPGPEPLPESASALRNAYTELMARFAGRKRPDPAAVVPPLCDLHGRLRSFDDLSHAERRRMLRGVESRLVDLHGRLLRERADRPGGGSVARADELIRLIQSTVAPDSWDVNGGRNTIRFWSPNPALVIRATGEVHHQVGGTLGGLRE